MSDHHDNCDVNDINPDGIKKPCNCGESGASRALIFYTSKAAVDIAYRQIQPSLDYGGPDDAPKAIDALIVALNEFKKVLTNT